VASLYNSALCQYVLGMADTASHQLETVTRRDPSFVPAYFLLGFGHAVARRMDEALAVWQKATTFEPGNVDLHANIGFVHYRRGNWEKAVEHYMKAHRAAPTDADILSALGLSYARAANVTRLACEALVERQNTAVIKQQRPGNELRQMQQTWKTTLGKGIVAFQESLKLNARSPITYSNLGLAYYFNNQVETAMENWRIVSRLDSRYAKKREESDQFNYDDSVVTLRPLNWRTRVIKMAPILPRQQTRLVPGYNARAFRPALNDPELTKVWHLRRDLEYSLRSLGWLNVRK
jgi:tetratricopeptide (TPR) repeat protein